MSVAYKIYLLHSNDSPPDFPLQHGIFSETGMEFSPTSFRYVCDKYAIELQDSGVGIFDLRQFDELTNEVKAGLVQEWRSDNGGWFAFGNVVYQNKVIGVLEVSGRRLSPINESMLKKNRNFSALLCDFILKMNISRMIAICDTDLSENDAISLLLSDDLPASANLDDVRGVSFISAPGAPPGIPPGFENHSNGNTKIYLRYPLVGS